METIIAFNIWIMLYQPPFKDEFKIHQTQQPIEIVQNGGASVSASPESSMPPILTSTGEQQPLTVETYNQVRPEPTGCYLGDSIPLEACKEK